MFLVVYLCVSMSGRLSDVYMYVEDTMLEIPRIFVMLLCNKQYEHE